MYVLVIEITSIYFAEVSEKLEVICLRATLKKIYAHTCVLTFLLYLNFIDFAFKRKVE